MTDSAAQIHRDPAINGPRLSPVYGPRRWSGWVLGPACLLATLLLPAPAGLSEAGWKTAGAGALMAVLWITEAIPIPATALLPLVLFPLLGLGAIKEVAAPYANPIIYLFLGGFLIAQAMRRWNLHRRVAINLIGAVGASPPRIVGGFLLASAAVSMWVSNTATALMMLPIALSVAALLPEHSGDSRGRAFGLALMLAVAYGATTGGMATLIGTPPNALLAGFVSNSYQRSIGFGQWMLLGLPVTLVALPLVYLVLTRLVLKPGGGEMPGLRELIRQEKAGLGRLSFGEGAVAAVFALTALGWVTAPLIAAVFPFVTDTTIALAGALVLFLIPVDARQGSFVMDWETAKGVPWDVLLLFGGGLSLASVIERHGLAAWLGELSQGLSHLPVLLTMAIICFGILMLTELTSNTATAATFLPVAGSIAASLGHDPLLFLIPTALAANCSYMLPVGTPPNAIVFGSGMVTLPEMARVGFLLNVLLVPVVVGLVWWLAPAVFGFSLAGTAPSPAG